MAIVRVSRRAWNAFTSVGLILLGVCTVFLSLLFTKYSENTVLNEIGIGIAHADAPASSNTSDEGGGYSSFGYQGGDGPTGDSCGGGGGCCGCGDCGGE